MERLKDEDNEEGKKKEEEEEEVDDAIVVGVSDAVLDTVKRLKYKARARNFYISGVVVESMNGQTECRNKKSSRTEHKKIAKRKNLHIKPVVSANNGEENEESRYVNHIEE